MELLKSIRTIRKEKRIKQHELAKGIGIAQSYLSKIETGKSPNVPMDVVNRIFEYLGYEIYLHRVK